MCGGLKAIPTARRIKKLSIKMRRRATPYGLRICTPAWLMWPHLPATSNTCMQLIIFGRTWSTKNSTSPGASAQPAMVRLLAMLTSCPTCRLMRRPAPQSPTCFGTAACFCCMAIVNTSTFWNGRFITVCFRAYPSAEIDFSIQILWHPWGSTSAPPGLAAPAASPTWRAFYHRCRAMFTRMIKTTCMLTCMSNSSDIALDAGKINITQTTNYPWEGKVDIEINPAKSSNFTLRVRIPGWAVAKPVPGGLYSFVDAKAGPVNIYVNGKSYTYQTEKG